LLLGGRRRHNRNAAVPFDDRVFDVVEGLQTVTFPRGHHLVEIDTFVAQRGGERLALSTTITGALSMNRRMPFAADGQSSQHQVERSSVCPLRQRRLTQKP
jgi:hypothetical protein